MLCKWDERPFEQGTNNKYNGATTKNQETIMTMEINNENEEYIYLRKDLFNRWGLIKGLIIQYLINGNGEFIGSVGSFCNVVDIGSDGSVKNYLRELEELGVIKREKIRGWTNRFTLVSESYAKKKN